MTATRKKLKRPIHNAATKCSKGHVVTIYSETDDTVCFRFGAPLSSHYALKIAVMPGHIFIGGDCGEMVITHYHAALTPISAFGWLCSPDNMRGDWFDYHLGKSNIKKVVDHESTKKMILERIKELKKEPTCSDKRENIWLIESLESLVEDIEEMSGEAILYRLQAFDDYGYSDYRYGEEYPRSAKFLLAMARIAGLRYLKLVDKRNKAKPA